MRWETIESGPNSKCGFVYISCSCSLTVFIVLFLVENKIVVRPRMLLDFYPLPGQLIMGFCMGELDGVAGVGGLLVTDGKALNKMFFPSLGLFASCHLDLMSLSCIG